MNKLTIQKTFDIMIKVYDKDTVPNIRKMKI